MDWLATLKEWQDLATGLLTIAAAFIGGGYVVHSTNRQVALLADQFRETNRPFVIAKLGTYAGVIFSLEIENIGRSPATSLRLSLDKDFYPFGNNKNLRELEAFNREIPTFAPGERMTFLLSQGHKMDNVIDGVDRTPSRFSVSAMYDFQSRAYAETYLIDTEHYNGVLALKRNSDILSDIAGHLKTMASKA